MSHYYNKYFFADFINISEFFNVSRECSTLRCNQVNKNKWNQLGKLSTNEIMLCLHTV